MAQFARTPTSNTQQSAAAAVDSEVRNDVLVRLVIHVTAVFALLRCGGCCWWRPLSCESCWRRLFQWPWCCRRSSDFSLYVISCRLLRLLSDITCFIPVACAFTKLMLPWCLNYWSRAAWPLLILPAINLDYFKHCRLCRYCFYSGPIFLVFYPAGAIDTLHRSRWNLVGMSLPDKFHLGRLKGVGLRPPKLWKFWIAPKGWIPCAILIKFIGFMRVLGLHNSTKFSCLNSINNKAINNLPRWGNFSEIFDGPWRLN